MTFEILHTNQKMLEELGKLKPASFTARLKIVKILEWKEKNLKYLADYAQEIYDEFKIKERFTFDEKGTFIGENRDEFISELGKQSVKEKDLLSTVIDSPPDSFTAEEIELLDLPGEDLLTLSKLELFTL